MKPKEKKYVEQRRKMVEEHDNTLWDNLEGVVKLPSGAARLLVHFFAVTSTCGMHGLDKQSNLEPQGYRDDYGYALFEPETRSAMDDWLIQEPPQVTVVGYPDTAWNPWNLSANGTRLKLGEYWDARRKQGLKVTQWIAHRAGRALSEGRSVLVDGRWRDHDFDEHLVRLNRDQITGEHFEWIKDLNGNLFGTATPTLRESIPDWHG